MFGRKAALIKHYEGEVDRLRQRVTDLEHRNSVLVDRLLAKHGVPQATKMDMPSSPADLNSMAIFDDLEGDEPQTDNRKGDPFDAFVG